MESKPEQKKDKKNKSKWKNNKQGGWKRDKPSG